jgi:putative transposase
MPNHVHLLLTPDEDFGVSRMMQQLGRKYVYYYNFTHSRTGTLWEGRFRSSVIATTRYLLACHRYIEMNPVRAGLASHPRDFEWSSYRTNALGQSSSLITQHKIVTTLGDSVEDRCEAYRRLFIGIQEESDQVIRYAGQTGMTL